MSEYSIGNVVHDAERLKDIWHNIITRCGNPKYPTYVDCKVCKEWELFENFELWYKSHFYNVSNEKMCIDKDLLFKGNKLYSPETCCIVPETINMLLTNRKRFRGDLPVGVTRKDNKYMAKCKINGKDKYIGFYKTVDEAFGAYKTVKESYIKDVAKKYKSVVPDVVYNALINYEIDITD